MEIERKWLLRQLPNRPPDKRYWTEQFYLSLKPEVRLRRKKNRDTDEVKYFLTLKGEGALARPEVETMVSEDFYNQALDLISYEPIQKNFLIYYDAQGNEVEVSIILGKQGFIYAEVEFNTEEEALAYDFPWPEFVEREITNDTEFKMKNFWSRINS